ncbi:hypothetical protein M409DRAFT_69076 [Zasmidium cellare ATCC 36951]|uniref:Major facilitator superfamily (MFS) profile domain-containing protein n=1 Tax=Zasmidium cellare ATCC 36951 TaxID=1080233 RepID=A0A6A6C632_ZASCE|nr:uncharacterized protein M409DRAFT_69076 [Zasmidium cellare ATCC 36951]KAF2162475.1 hypothetical protein M409DRAFT_69076 [Zasmidium cellare ATCC 36951]
MPSPVRTQPEQSKNQLRVDGDVLPTVESATSEDHIDDKENKLDENNADYGEPDKPYSVFTHGEKRIIIFCAGVCSFLSPVSGQIYFPALNQISADLNVSYDLVNLTITTYLIMQGLAPAFIGSLSDAAGRRPAYIACFIIYMAANLGLGLQNNYAALMVLRCVQSAGSSGTVSLAQAVAADIITSAERGVYVSYMSVAPQAGPSLGPIIGGLIGQYCGWHWIFWFLLIVSGTIFVPVALFFPETCRKVVDDGSVPPPKWNRCLTNAIRERRAIREGHTIPWEGREELARARSHIRKLPNPWESLKIVFTKQAGFIMLYAAIVVCGYYAVASLIPSQFGQIYGFNEIQIALCYLPFGFGSLLAGLVRGRFIDSRYRVHAKRRGLPLEKNRNVDLSNFPIERARLEVAIPTLAMAAAAEIGFGWMVQAHVNLAGPLIFLFVIGFCASASVNVVQVLLVDTFPGKAGSATAANNLMRCWFGAGVTSGVIPMINKIGIGWTTTFFALLPVLFSPILWYVMVNGPKWRKEYREKNEQKAAKKQAKADVAGEKGIQGKS